MASMYSAKVMEHFANPHNVGEIPDANGVGEVGNPKCGDIMRMYLKIENNVIVDVKFLQKLTVLVSIFGRDTPVELGFNQVEKLS